MLIFLSDPVKSVLGIAITLSGPISAATKVTPPAKAFIFEKDLPGFGVLAIEEFPDDPVADAVNENVANDPADEVVTTYAVFASILDSKDAHISAEEPVVTMWNVLLVSAVADAVNTKVLDAKVISSPSLIPDSSVPPAISERLVNDDPTPTKDVFLAEPVVDPVRENVAIPDADEVVTV